MSETSELFWRGRGHGVIMPGDKNALELLQQAAMRWRNENRHLNAGLAMEDAICAAWGNGKQVQSCAEAAVQDYEASVGTVPPCAHEGLFALYQLAAGFHRHILGRAPRDYYLAELGQRLLQHFSDSPNADSYLVRGFILRGNLDDEWEPSFPPFVQLGRWLFGQKVIETSLPSAFQLFIWLADYQGADAIAQRCPAAFNTQGLRGWRAAVRGFVRPEEAREHFADAAAAFSEDTMPVSEDLQSRGGAWSSQNIDLWTKYFRARAALASIAREPACVAEAVREAASAVQGTDSGWVNGNVSRFRILVQTLAQLLGQAPGLSPNAARDEFRQQARWTDEQAGDEVSLRFLSLVGEAFDGFRRDPAAAMVSGHLPSAMEALGRVPLIGSNVSSVIAPAIGAIALREAHGPDRTWVHRTLESITDERIFQKIILRLLQASPSPPAYGQIRHGPLEYGKDVAVLLEEGGRQVLRMYQAKCGDITIPVWREVRPQLEEIFLVDIAALQLRVPVDGREGFLVGNGHAQPHVEPTMEGWFTQELRDHGHTFRFMHLDDMVTWIFGQRLFSAFRSACAELGLPLA
jgi:hypothetical protein